MTAFYVLTQRSVVGPFSGVELREAALAGILRPDGIIGGDLEGPWYNASEIGLFSEKMTPVPHPPDVPVPQFQVRGMSGAFQGPFKLRELIGFASRGMMPADALLQCDQDESQRWVPAIKVRMLKACLNGDLVLLDAAGQLIKRNISLTELDLHEVQDARAPIELAGAVNHSDVTAQAPPESVSDHEYREPIVINLVERPLRRRLSRRSRWWSELDLRNRIRQIHSPIPLRYTLQLSCVLLILAGAASAYSYWKQIGLKRSHVIGHWIALDGEDAEFGIALNQEGSCVIMNAKGESWTGRFEWNQRSDDESGFEDRAPMKTVFDHVQAGHDRDDVRPTDGYIRLEGDGIRLPEIDGHPIQDLFLRRKGDVLKFGYLTAVYWMKQSRTMEAGWVEASKSTVMRPDITAELRAIQPELPVPTEGYGGERPRHISEAIDVVRRGTVIQVGSEEKTVYQTLAYSEKVDAGYLLARYGMPDEARALHEFEVPELRNGPSFEDAQVARYDDLQFILSPAGKLLFLTTGKHSTSARSL